MNARAFLLLGLLGACNFDAAFSRYCQNNPNCKPDAGKDLGPNPSPDLGPDLSMDTFVPPDSGRPDGGGGGRPDSGGGGLPPFFMRSCASPADCNAPMETCHPTTQTCIPTCRSPADCPYWLDACIDPRGPFGGPTSMPRICACSNSQVCRQLSPDFSCNAADNLCTPPCYSNADCPTLRTPRKCSPFSNVCVECVETTDCSGRTDGFTECDSRGLCVRSAH